MMILQEHQRVNIVVRGLIFKEQHLLVTQWRTDGVAFPIGGRVEFGEPLVDALQREVREETGAAITVRKLLYVGENVFRSRHGRDYHEYGWYFWVELDRDICALDDIIPNPDHPDLVIRYVKVDVPGLRHVVPQFLARCLPGDLAQGFSENPRYLYSADHPTGTAEVHEIGEFFTRALWT